MAADILSNVWPEWKIEGKPLGRGSYGTVYKAVRRDHNVESYAAIKVISIPADQSELDSLRSEGYDENASRTYLQGVVNDFVSEIQLMESFKGVQNIVSVEDYRVVEKKDAIGWDIFIRMELLTPLNNYICDRSLTEPEVIKLGVDICSALELCATRNVIHRDIKPENIFVNQFGDFKLGDFGIARKLENVTGGLSQKGTYNYMAPEVEKGSQYDATVDLYSLGLVLYRFTNKNRLPFLDTERQVLNPNDRMAAIRRRMDGEALPPPCEASPALAQIILYACAPDPKRRFTSATAMKNALIYAAGGANAGNKIEYNKTVAVRHAQQVQDPNRTTSVRKAPQTQQAEQKTIDTFGEKKKSKLPLIIAAALIFALLVGACIYFLPKLLNKDSDSETDPAKDPASTSERTSADGSNHGEGSADTTAAATSSFEEEQIAAAIQEADALAASADYEGALTRIRTALAAYPSSEALQTKEAEYADALAAQVKAKTLEEAASLASSGDYKGAMTVIEKARSDYQEDNEYKTAHDNYQRMYFAQVKTNAITEAESLAQEGYYLAAISKIEEASAIIGADTDLEAKQKSYEYSYAADISAQIDSYLAENEIAAAKTLIDKALKELPDNETLKARKAELDQYKSVSMSSLTPINGGFSWNEGTPEDPFGNDYTDVQNYCSFHARWSSHSEGQTFSAEYKLDMEYDYLTFTISPYSDFGQYAQSYLQIYVDGVLRYTSPRIYQKTEPFSSPVIDISDAEYLKMVVKVGDYGCLLLTDVMLQSTPSFVSELDQTVTSLTSLSPLNGSLPWEDSFPEDIVNSDYSFAQNYALLYGRWNSHSEGLTYSAEYYIAKKYDSISFKIAPATCFGQSASTTVKVYADDELVYTSKAITQKTTQFSTGEINLEDVNYVKIVVQLGDYGCIILSDVLLTNAE